MATNNSSSTKHRSVWIKWSCLVGLLLVLAFYFYPREKAELNAQGYDAAVALYRICNQKDEASLQKVAGQITQWKTDEKISASTHTTLQRVIDSANAGDWRKAGRDCRQLMEDQVRR